jgi:hypothetical protein
MFNIVPHSQNVCLALHTAAARAASILSPKMLYMLRLRGTVFQSIFHVITELSKLMAPFRIIGKDGFPTFPAAILMPHGPYAYGSGSLSITSTGKPGYINLFPQFIRAFEHSMQVSETTVTQPLFLHQLPPTEHPLHTPKEKQASMTEDPVSAAC